MTTNTITFTKGNFSAWEKFVNEELPLRTDNIKNNVLQAVNETLASMLGTSTIEGVSIDVDVNCDKAMLGFNTTIVYHIEDFESPNAPQSAIESDQRTISDSIVNIEGIIVKDVTIDVKDGILTVSVYSPISIF